MSSPTAKLLFVLLILSGCSTPKQAGKTDIQTLNNLKAHIQYLADDKLEGRRTGSNGEKLAMEYIIEQFKAIGIVPKGTEYYVQSFMVDDGKQMGPTTQLMINGNELQTGKDFFAFPFSPNQSIEALPAISIRESGMPWFYDLKEILEENKTNPHFDLGNHIRDYSKNAISGGASAVILYNSSSIDDELKFEPKDRSEQLAIPLVYVFKEPAKKYFSDKGATLNIKLRIELDPKNRLGNNVIGYIDNRAVTTIVLGAHFDHLGYGEDGNSMLRTGEKLIHNGADDNASGTAALIELARKLKISKATHNNYLFIAFSGEELGLFGSKYFTEHPTIDLNNVSCMINMDMVGRLNDSTKVITIGGYGTSPAWGELFSSQVTGKNPPGFIFKYDSSGTGPSDHTSFYRKNIPVLFYFTGLHKDYHKPTDDADKINYTGEVKIVQQIYNLVESLNNKGKLVFTKTRETQTSTNTSFKVTLGIMPDYTYAGTGVRADGVSDGRPAQKAGLQAGDVIIQLGDNNVTSLDNYMQALGKFKKGDKTKVKFKRGNEIIEATIEF
jgi:aminopeptidase YwaD